MVNSSTEGKTALKKDVFDGALYFTEGKTTFFALELPLLPEEDDDEDDEEEDEEREEDPFPEEDCPEAVLFVSETVLIWEVYCPSPVTVVPFTKSK